jgi:cytochrome c biogenesis protein CcmG, thiol:disulfide interchange protein DsbE
MNRTVLFIGLFIGVALILILAVGFRGDPGMIASPLVGRSAPPFALREVGTGRTVSLEQFRGRPVVLNFWATWCGPCYEEHPTLVANARTLQPGVQFLGVVFQDNEDKIQKFLDERGRAYPTVVDDAGKTAIAYGVGGVPETFFLDRAGNIAAKFTGPMTTEILQENLAKAMKQ